MLAQHYGAALEQLDFTQPEGRKAAARRINQWASEQTAGRIPSVVAPNNFGPCLPPTWECTRLVITNAIYFKGLWKEKHDFDETATKDEDIDFSDIPELDETFWREAKLVKPDLTEQVTMRIKRSVLDYFRAPGKGYQTRINRVLESYVRAQRESR